MSTIKTKIDPKNVMEFLTRYFNGNIVNLVSLKGGEMSQAFSFSTDLGDFVIRVNKERGSYDKDLYAYKHFDKNLIPMPEMIEIGSLGERLFYAISKKSSGKNLDEWDDDAILGLLPQLFGILDVIHAQKIPESEFGYWDGKGEAYSRSWKEFILLKDDELRRGDELTDDSFLEMDVVNRVDNVFKGLVKYLPEEKCLVHGDYGFNNIITDGRKITGVLDWGEGMYGDFMYDVSWLSFWSSNIPYGKLIKKHYMEIEKRVEKYDERLLCYEICIGMGALGFFVKSDQRGSYEWTKKKLESLLALAKRY